MTVASVNKRTTETKFVTCFADARPDVDITFRDVLLTRPTDHYLVGIDNFSMASTGLSMIEPLSGDYEALLRIVKNRAPDIYAPAGVGSDTAENLDIGFQATPHNLDYMHVVNVGWNFEILTTEVHLSVQQLLHRLNELAAQVNLFMNMGLASAAHGFQGEFGYVNGIGETTEHLRFDIRSDGRLEIRGTRAFWGCFSIEVPSPQYQFGFWGDRQESDDNHFKMRRFLSVNPVGAGFTATYNKIKVNPVKISNESIAALGGAAQLAARAYNRRTIFGAAPQAITIATELGGQDPNQFNQHGGNLAHDIVTIVQHASCFSTLERRVAIECGTSLPIKNSPMIDHQKETPDFVRGRWIWRTDSRIESNDRGGSRRYGSIMPACIEYQGPQDRITYHELQAQAKIQTLRIKLFARVRSFDAVTEKWTMRVFELPTNDTDWWHCRVHFVSKD